MSDSRSPAVAMRVAQLYFIRGRQPITATGDCVFAPPGRADVAPLRLRLPLNWDMDPYHDRNWCAQLHMWRMMDEYFFCYEKNADPLWLQTPLDIIVDYANFHLVRGRRSRYAWKDMMVGLRAMKLGYVMSQHLAGQVTLTSRQLAACEELIERHASFLSDFENVRFSNHTFIDVHGAMALCQVTQGPIRQALEAIVARVLPELLGAQFSATGVHLENSPKYQIFGLGCLKRLKQSRWFGDYKVDALYARAERIMHWLQLPDGRMVPVGDTAGSLPPKDRVPVDYGRGLGVLNDSGYVVIRQTGISPATSAEASYLFFMGAFNSKFHKHQDDLSFVWFEGQDILCDSGQYAYKSDPYEEYVLSTRAHNTVEIDSTNHYQSTGNDPQLAYGSAVSRVETHTWGCRVSAQVDHRRWSVVHSRTLLYGPKRWVLVIDDVVSPDEHNYTQWFHFCPSIRLVSAGQSRYEAALTDRRRLTTIACTGGVSVQQVRGQTTPRLQGWISRGYREIEPNDALGLSSRGRCVQFVTLFVIDDDGSECVSDSAGGLRLSIRTTGGGAPLSLLARLDAHGVWSVPTPE